MKLILIIIVVLLIFSNLISQEFEINKLDEIAYAQGYTTSDGIQIIDNNLYYMSHNGLEIYELNPDNSITKISMLTIPKPLSMVIYGQYCFISAGDNLVSSVIPGYQIQLYKIDISDVTNPIIADQIVCNEIGEHYKIFSIGNHLIVNWIIYNSGTPTDIYYDFYALPELNYIGQIISDNFYKPINDSLLVKQDDNILTTVQYNTPNEFEVIGTTDVSTYLDDGGYYEHFKTISDTIVSAINLKNVTFWDVNNPSDWQYVSRFTLPENVQISGYKQYSIVNENIVIFTSSNIIRLLDISNIINPVEVDYLFNETPWGKGSCDNFGSNLYVSTVTDGIQHYIIENNTLDYDNSYFEHSRFSIGDIYNNNLITSMLKGGYYLFDIADPLNPLELGMSFENSYYELLNDLGNWIVLRNFDDFRFEIYDMTDPINPSLRNFITYNNPEDLSWAVCVDDDFDGNSLYICNFESKCLRKFDLTEPGEAIELLEYQLPISLNSLSISNSFCYATYGSSPCNLQVIDGLDNNNPNLVNEILNFSENLYIDVNGGFLKSLCVLDPDKVAKIYSLENPLQPTIYFVPQWGNSLDIRNDLIFARFDYLVAVYENRSNSTEPIAVFNGLNYIYNIELFEMENIKYILTQEWANIGLFEYTYVPSSTEVVLPNPEDAISNYPNPFNPETNIVFSLPKDGEVQLEIFNIKGQKIKTLLHDQIEAGEHSITWNGEDAAGKKVSSGIYLYKLKVNDDKEMINKCILLK